MPKCDCNDKPHRSTPKEHENACDTSPINYIKNPYINEKEDILFHLTLSNKSDDLHAMFHDVKFVCLGGTVNRMRQFAEFLKKELGLPADCKVEDFSGKSRKSPEDCELLDITGKGHRYSMFKVGSVLCVNHGMGFPTMMILLHELIKLMQYAGVRDPIFIRTGTSGGFDVSAGTVVISTQVLDDFLEPCLTVPILGKNYKWPCHLDQTLARDLKSIAEEKGGIPVLIGRTVSQLHFYEGTAMKAGAICEHTDEDRKEYFDRLKECKVLCADMEALVLGAITYKVGIKAAFVSVVVNDAFAAKEDAPTLEEMKEWQKRPGKIVAEYIKRHL